MSENRIEDRLAYQLDQFTKQHLGDDYAVEASIGDSMLVKYLGVEVYIGVYSQVMTFCQGLITGNRLAEVHDD